MRFEIARLEDTKSIEKCNFVLVSRELEKSSILRRYFFSKKWKSESGV